MALFPQLEGMVKNAQAAASGNYVSNLPEVNDPEKVYADLTRRDYESYVRDFRAFEERLIASKDDTSLIDKAREDAAKQSRISSEIQQRNLERYGGAGLSVVQRQEQQRALQRGQQLNLAGGLNNALIQQREINQRTLADLINIGQGVNRSALSGLGDASAMAAQRAAAYKNAKAQHNNNMVSLGTTAALAFFGI
jgi:hypothetical protein